MKLRQLLEYVVFLYNDEITDSEKFGALTYLLKICHSLDTLKPSQIMNLDLQQLQDVLSTNNKALMLKKYTYIRNQRQLISKQQYSRFVKLASSKKYFVKELSEDLFKYCSSIYNSNSILQDNLTPSKYLIKITDKLNNMTCKQLMTLRMHQILNILDISTTQNTISIDSTLKEILRNQG